MKTRIEGGRWKIAALLFCVAAIPVLADLTITITPGYQFSTSERPTMTTLNLLGRPSAQVTGTLGGTNVTLGAATISGTHLMDSVAGSNLTWNAASPRGLVVAPQGIYASHLGPDIAGSGLAGGAGVTLSVNVGGSNLVILSDTLRIVAPSGQLIGGDAQGYATNITVGTGLRIVNNGLALSASNDFTSFSYAVSGTVLFNTNHSLGAVPGVASFKLVNVTADIGFVPGDEVAVTSFGNSGGVPVFAGGANATNVFLVWNGSTTFVVRKDTGAYDNITASRWVARCVAKP